MYSPDQYYICHRVNRDFTVPILGIWESLLCLVGLKLAGEPASHSSSGAGDDSESAKSMRTVAILPSYY
jgi:hypothetical protein